jgi:hypothetical protein
MANKSTHMAIALGAACMAAGCAAGPKASLEIRSVEHSSSIGNDSEAIARGKELLERKQYADAISAFRAALRVEKGSAEANNGLAIAYDHLGRKDLAQRYFELAVAERPSDMRYRRNLARFFEQSGQVQLAQGLLEAPAEPSAPVEVLASIQPVLVASDFDPAPIIGPTFVETDVLPADPIGTLLAGLELAPPHVVQTAEPEDRIEAPLPTPQPIIRRIDTIAAVYRPAAPVAIETLLPAGQKLPQPGPDGGLKSLAAMLPPERRHFQTEGPYIERVSLGQVNLVTQPNQAPASTGFDIDELGKKLALWANDEERLVLAHSRQGLRGKLAIQSAVERAAVDDALSAAVQLAEAVDDISRTFAYASFDDNAEAAVT